MGHSQRRSCWDGQRWGQLCLFILTCKKVILFILPCVLVTHVSYEEKRLKMGFLADSFLAFGKFIIFIFPSSWLYVSLLWTVFLKFVYQDLMIINWLLMRLKEFFCSSLTFACSKAFSAPASRLQHLRSKTVPNPAEALFHMSSESLSAQHRTC